MKNNYRIILASASPRRKEIMESMGFEIEILPADVDESTDIIEPDKVVEELARRKCLKVVEDLAKSQCTNSQCINSDCTNSDSVNVDCTNSDIPTLVIGADTVVAADGNILGKPIDADDAVNMIRMLSDKTHQVYTGIAIALVKDGMEVALENYSVCTDVHVLAMSEIEIEEYIATGEAFDKAGAYGIQGAFGKFIDRIEGDYFNVVGLPKAAIYSSIKNLV